MQHGLRGFPAKKILPTQPSINQALQLEGFWKVADSVDIMLAGRDRKAFATRLIG
jgi:hypothetical protein